MGFKLTDLIIESILRDGLENLRRMPEIVDDLFSQLVSLPASLQKKYGDKEINKIKDLVQNTEVSIIHSFPTQNTEMPCISIQLMESEEEVDLASMGDYQGQAEVPMTPQQLQGQTIVSNLQITDYDANSGILSLSDAQDLSNVHPGQNLIDGNGVAFQILSGIDNTPGQKQVIIGKNVDIDVMAPAYIQSSITTNIFELKTNAENERLLLGIHTKDALQTKYLYNMVKYFLESRKDDLVSQGFMLATYKGSDFNLNSEYASDFIYSRYLTVSGKFYNTWNSDQVIPIDWLEVQVKVPRATATNEDLGLTNQTVQVEDDDKQ